MLPRAGMCKARCLVRIGAAQRTVTRRSLDNGMVKFEVVLPSDEAAIVWAALNAAIDTVKAEPTPAEPSHIAKPPGLTPPTAADRGRHRADAFMNLVQQYTRGNRPQRTPIEIIITVPHAGLHGSAEPSDLATMADGEVIATAK